MPVRIGRRTLRRHPPTPVHLAPEVRRPAHRIGVVVPYDMALDHELERWTPPQAALYTTRTAYEPLAVTMEMVQAVSESAMIEEASRSLRTVEPEVTVYGCTSGSFCRGLAAEPALARAVAEGSGGPALTTSGAILSALDALAAHRVVLVTPYTADITAAFSQFLGEGGIDVVATARMDLQERIFDTGSRELLELILTNDRPEARAVVVSCTNLPTYDLIPYVELIIGKPVISANQATMWRALQEVGLGLATEAPQRLAQVRAHVADRTVQRPASPATAGPETSPTMGVDTSTAA